MTILPSRNNILVRLRDLTAQQTIVLLDPAKQFRNPYGEVIAVGPEVNGFAAVGDKVLFLPSQSLPMPSPDPEEGETTVYFLVPEVAILGKYVEPETNLN